MRTLLISAAEASGDRLAAALVRALGPGVRARGIAGPAMRAAGVEPVARVEEVAVMGLAEVLGRLGAIRRARRAMEAAIDAGADALVVVDAPDLHLPLARRARARGIPAIGYVSPQVWAWRPGRVDGIAASLDALLCLFDFEPALYAEAARRHGTRVLWVGHPVVDRLRRRQRVDPHLWGLLPGSRPQELRRHLRPFLAAAGRLRAARPRACFRLVLPTGTPAPALPPGVEVVRDVEALAEARGALTKSGTVTLELARMGVPAVVAHRVHPVTWVLGRLLVRNVRHLAMPNVLADRAGRPPPMPEHLQRFTPDDLARALLALPERQPVDLSALGEPGAAGRAAAALRAIVEGRP